jgi:SAM-dependent methyltransferase
MKDLFSGHASDYAAYRPRFPKEPVEWLVTTQLQATDAAWDCGTGNGQVASLLNPHFTQVYATDISSQQLAQAPQMPNVVYRQAPAEDSGLPTAFFDAVVVAQAVHWFRFSDFYKEVRRVLKPEGRLMLLCYGLVQVGIEEIDALLKHLYSHTLGTRYWDAERHYIDERYQTIPFPFSEVTVPPFTMQYEWSLSQLLDYLRTWSAVKHFQTSNGYNPVDDLEPQLEKHWPQGHIRTVSFPLVCRVGKL